MDSTEKTTLKIAVDGPSGAGKSSLARAVASRLRIVYADTGALYRAVGLFALRQGVDPTDTEGVVGLLCRVTVSFDPLPEGQRVYLCGEDVTAFIRTPEVSHAASAVSAIPEVRRFLFSLQRNIAEQCDVIMDGRDIGTVILPDAQVKIFLTASETARAKRRCAELTERGVPCSMEQLLREQKERDERDSSRKIAPAIPADDAVLLDNSDLTPEETVQEVLELVRKKTGR